MLSISTPSMLTLSFLPQLPHTSLAVVPARVVKGGMYLELVGEDIDAPAASEKREGDDFTSISCIETRGLFTYYGPCFHNLCAIQSWPTP